jgi:hypothetical protein
MRREFPFSPPGPSVGLRPIPRYARDQHCVLSCALRAGPAGRGEKEPQTLASSARMAAMTLL